MGASRLRLTALGKKTGFSFRWQLHPGLSFQLTWKGVYFSDAGTCAAVTCSVLVLAILFFTRTSCVFVENFAGMSWLVRHSLDLCRWAIFNSMVIWHHVLFPMPNRFINRFWITSCFNICVCAMAYWLPTDVPVVVTCHCFCCFYFATKEYVSRPFADPGVLPYVIWSYEHMSTWKWTPVFIWWSSFEKMISVVWPNFNMWWNIFKISSFVFICYFFWKNILCIWQLSLI